MLHHSIISRTTEGGKRILPVSENSKIDWLEGGKTLNPILGCTKVSAGCQSCYAARFASRGLTPNHRAIAKGGEWTGKIRYAWSQLDKPLHWRKPRRIFLCSMFDLFHDRVGLSEILRVVARVAECPQHEFVVLTKRPWRLDMQCGLHVIEVLPENLTVGVSVENHDVRDRIDILRKVPATRRIISFEPLIGDVGKLDLDGIHGVIVGGETGPKARPMHPDWVRRIRDDCADAGVPFWFKSWGSASGFKGDVLDGKRHKEWCKQ
ncbi:MAG: phage Gp37/Gp68 family protein [bacterium]